jgi:hypothetical protein
MSITLQAASQQTNESFLIERGLSILSEDGLVHKGQSQEPPLTLSLQKLSSQHHQIINYDLAGFRQNQIAELTSLSAVTISRVMSSDLYKQTIGALRTKMHDHILHSVSGEVAKARSVLLSNSVKVAENLVNHALLNDTPGSPRSCREILNMVGIKGDEQQSSPTIIVKGDAAFCLNRALQEPPHTDFSRAAAAPGLCPSDSVDNNARESISPSFANNLLVCDDSSVDDDLGGRIPTLESANDSAILEEATSSTDTTFVPKEEPQAPSLLNISQPLPDAPLPDAPREEV